LKLFFKYKKNNIFKEFENLKKLLDTRHIFKFLNLGK
jgi:hypothetical protein